MHVAVVTPYYREPLEKLERCHASVLRQTHADVTHIMVADGFPRPEVNDWPRCQHIPLPLSHADSGDAPRLIGCASAAAQAFDAVLLLDADNWFQPDHIETLLRVQQRHAALVVTCARRLLRPDNGELLGLCTESDGRRFNDTNCYLVMEQAFSLFAAWGLRTQQVTRSIGGLGDCLFWDAVSKSNAHRVHSPLATVNYETSFAIHYLSRKLPLPDFAKVNVWLPAEERYRQTSYAEYRELVAAGHTADQGY